MLSSLLLGSLLGGQTPQTFELTPSADAWVYPHSSDPGGETLMRIWGDGAEAVDSKFPSDGGFAYGYLVFDVPKLVDGVRFKVESASLIVFAQANEELTPAVMREFPLQVRGLEKTFEEKTFHIDTFKQAPYAGIFGLGLVAEKVGENNMFKIDLLAKDSHFEDFFNTGARSGKFAIALTSKITPAESRSLIYKVFTKENDKALVPKLVVKVQ